MTKTTEPLVEAIKKIELKYDVTENEISADTQISPTKLDDCVCKQAGLRAYWGVRQANADAQLAFIKRKFDTIEAQLYAKYRKAQIEAGEKATEKSIENAVRQDNVWKAMKDVVIEANRIADLNRAAVNAINDRRDMLIQLGADRRDERKGTMRITGGEDTSARGTLIANRAMRQVGISQQQTETYVGNGVVATNTMTVTPSEY